MSRGAGGGKVRSPESGVRSRESNRACPTMLDTVFLTPDSGLRTLDYDPRTPLPRILQAHLEIVV